eukprot:CAMPEP_0177685936 /NCGR_PEP_ID=MMETSP0447-20121125/33297_1 /TAXON_ID=0 /ORGANISM="Stygamoeba regulata, Strain BSH-02190019" /LENGTH=381 /DNA_ID=CAMNT_0019196017 /DNA_START=3 /DNA_END=1148 /DNA_ORIENTATION=-
MALSWATREVSNDQKKARRTLKKLIRRGVSDGKRRKVWQAVVGTASTSESDKNYAYEAAVRYVFGDSSSSSVKGSSSSAAVSEAEATKIVQVPTFGGRVRFQDHYLTEQGEVSAKRIMCILAKKNPDVDYCPELFDMVCVALHFLREPETFLLLQEMLKQSKTKNLWYFRLSAVDSKMHVLTFGRLLQQHDRALYLHAQSLGFEPGEYAADWFRRLFVGHLPMPVVLRVLDCYLAEGSKILYRVALSLLTLIHGQLLKATSRDEFENTVAWFCYQVDGTALLKYAFSQSISKKNIHNLDRKSSGLLDQVNEPTHQLYNRPRLSGPPSAILSETDWETVYQFLPAVCSINDPVVVRHRWMQSSTLHPECTQTSTHSLADPYQ